MKNFCCYLVISIGTAVLSLAANGAAPASNDRGAGSVATAARPVLLHNDARLPISFEANAGQADARVKFLARGRGYSLFLTGSDAVLTLESSGKSTATPEFGKLPPSPLSRSQSEQTSLRMSLLGANPRAKTVGLEELPGRANYYIGNDPSKWRVNVPTYAKVKYESVYPGVDLVYYGNEQQLEYDFVVAPGADPKSIRLAVRDITGRAATARTPLKLDANGDLIAEVNGSELRFHKPVVYQSAAHGERVPVEGRYSLRGKSQVSFELGRYDRSKPLVIDPVLTYSTFLGGSNRDEGRGIALDTSLNMYIIGNTGSADFPTVNAFQGTASGAFVSKLKADGSALLYSTYFGDTSGGGVGNGGIAVDSAGNAFVTGQTMSATFPVLNALQSSLGGNSDAFVAKFNVDGTLAFSTYLGGTLSDVPSGIAVDSLGYVYVTGGTQSADFPVTPGVFQTVHGGAGFEIYIPNGDIFVTKIRPDGSALVYSTFLGGSNFFSPGDDYSASIAVDSAGNAYVVGGTTATDFPTTASAFQATAPASPNNAIVSKISPDASALLYSTYLGGSFANVIYGVNDAQAVAVDDVGHAYVTGFTASTNFPTVNALQGTHAGGDYDAFVAGFDTTQAGPSSLLFSTYFGGKDFDFPEGIALDGAGHLYVVGISTSNTFHVATSGFPTTANALQSTCASRSCGFLSKFTTDGQTLLYSSYLGGSGVVNDTGIFGVAAKARSVWVTGATESADFPVTPNALQSTELGPDAFVSVFSFRLFQPPIVSPLPVFLAGNGTTTFQVGPVDDLLGPLVFDVAAPPPGITVTPSHFELTPTSNDSASQILTAGVGPSVTPGTYTFSVVEQTTHVSTPVSVTVTASTSGMANVISTFHAAGCIGNLAIANALTTELNLAQNLANGHHSQAAIDTYGAMLIEIRILAAARLIAGTCTVTSVSFSPADALIGDVRGLMANLKVGSTANPITGYIVNSNNIAVANATVSLLDSTNAVVATATTDFTGFYFFPTGGVLTSGSAYSVTVAGVPRPFHTSSPASQSFTWEGSGFELGNFALN